MRKLLVTDAGREELAYTNSQYDRRLSEHALRIIGNHTNGVSFTEVILEIRRIRPEYKNTKIELFAQAVAFLIRDKKAQYTGDWE